MTGGLVQMIMLLNSRELAIELFDAYAPSLHIGEMDLGRSCKQRAEKLFERLDKFVDECPAEHGELFRALNTIAAVNSDSTNSKMILDYLSYHAALKRVYDSLHYAKMSEKRHSLALMAAFVAVRAKIGEGLELSEAKDLWQQLRVSASKVEQGAFLHKNITPPSHDYSQMSRGLLTFRDELEKYVRRTHQHKDYIAFVIPTRHSNGYISYYVNTSPPERDVLKVQDAKPVIGVDTNMTGFEIRYFYARDKVWISATKSGDQEYILQLFLQHVLGAKEEKQRKRHCEHRMPLFKYQERFASEITLPDESVASGEKVWISAMEIQVADDVSGDNFDLKSEGDDEYLPTIFKGTEALPIHDQINKQLNSKFDPKLWKVFYVELTAKLHPFGYEDDLSPLGETTDFAEVVFPIKPGGCTPRIESKFKNDRELRQKALALRTRWGLDGLSESEYALLPQKERDGEL